MKKFIGIGSDHYADVFDRVYKFLSLCKPEAITLEEDLSIWNTGDWSNNPRLEERAAEIMERPQFRTSHEYKKPAIKINDLFANDTRISERNAGIRFALETCLPFYFIDWSQDFPDHIFKFNGSSVLPLFLEGKTTYQNHPNEFENIHGRPIINSSNVDARNRFAADAINLLFEEYDSIAHIGGKGHFDSSTEPVRIFFGTFRLSPGLELQNLVKADNAAIYDAANDILI